MEANQRRRRRGGGGGGTGREELVQAGHKNSPRLDLFEKGKASMKGRTLVWALLLALIEFQVSADSDTSKVLLNNEDSSLGQTGAKFNIQPAQTNPKEDRDESGSKERNDASSSSQLQSQTQFKSLSISEAPVNGLAQVVPGSQASAGHRQPPMSCYVCSTMDYDNPTDNICRMLKHHPRLSQQTNGGHYHSSGFPDRQPSQANMMPSTRDRDTSASGRASLESSSGSANATSSPAEGYFPLASHRSASSQYVRTRACLDDENFCSIVSIVRIEFSNDNISSRFWAMERNCSRSCNTGCMLIGERVRLRVCSQCCRSPNCNIGSGVAALFSLNLERSLLLLVSGLVAVREILWRRKCISLAHGCGGRSVSA